MDLDSSISSRKAVHYVNEPTSSESPQSYDYETKYAGTSTPIVIDNGTYSMTYNGYNDVLM